MTHETPPCQTTATIAKLAAARLFLIVVFGCALLAACGGSSGSGSTSATKSSPTPSPTQTTGSVDACKLVTAAEASAATGATLTNLAAAGGVAIPGVCFYGSQDGTTSLLVYAQAYSDKSTADQISPNQIASILNGQYGITNAKSVSGIGDKAFEYSTTSASGSSGVAIFVFKANVILFIVMSPSTNASAVEQLARTAVSRL